MGYIEDLRKLIGHKRIVLNGSLVIIENKDGKILMQKRTYPKGKWGASRRSYGIGRINR